MEDAVSLLAVAKGLEDKGDYGNAAEAYEKVLSKDPKNEQALCQLGLIGIYMGELEDGLELLEEALAINPKNPRAMAYKAKAFIEDGSFNEAEALLAASQKIDPEAVSTWFWLGQAYAGQKDHAKAESAYKEALRLAPNHYHASFELGLVLAKQGESRANEAMAALLQTIGLNPAFSKPYIALGVANERLGDVEGAIKIYRTGIEYNPEAIDLRIRLANSLYLKGEAEAAHNELQVAGKLEGDCDELIDLGTSALVMGELQGAEQAFRKAIEIDPEAPGPHFYLAELYHAAEQPQRAIAEYEAAIANNNDDWKARAGLADLYLKYNEGKAVEKALVLLKDAVAKGPQDPDPYFNLALLEAKNNNFARAEELLLNAKKKAHARAPLLLEIDRLLATIKGS